MRTYIIVILTVCGLYYYVSQHFEFHDTLAFAKQHPAATWAPPVDYYVGLIYYQRADYPKAEEAFNQLLTDYPTCQYAANGLIHLDDAAEYNHDWETAKAAATRYTEEYQNEKDIELMRKRLELLKYQHP